ncbi:MAG: SurA N-terminal domain-containing protein [Hyphomonadaceae bacterium]
MLAQMRQLTRGIFARVLLGVLALAFAIWGVNDFFTGMSRNDVARVGDQSISPAELERDFSNWLDRQRGQEQPVSRQEAIEQGVHMRLLDTIIARRALSHLAKTLGIQASDQQVAEEIRGIEAAQDPMTGAFSERGYQELLQRIKYTPAEFEGEIRQSLAVQQLMEALAAGVRTPRSFGEIALAFDSERRVISLAEIPAARVGAIPNPTDAQVQALYNEMRSNLRVPEFRALTIVLARPADFAARVDVPEARIQEEFEARRAQYETPERRSFVQISAQTEAQARDAAQRLARGEEPSAVARALGVQSVAFENRPLTEIPDSAIGRAVFGLAANAPPQAVRGTLTPWVAVRVTAVTPAVGANIAEHRDEIRAQIAQDEATDVMNEAVAAFNDLRAEGAPLADAARRQGLAVIAVAAVTAEGRGQDGEPVAALQGQEELLQTAFETPEGEATDFIPTTEGDAIVSVDRVTPETTRPLQEVREQLTAFWINRERMNRLRAIGERVSEAVVAGRPFAEAVRANGGAMQVASREIDRETAGSALPARGFGAHIFEAHEGEVVFEPRMDGVTLLVAQVEAIRRADPAQEAQRVEQLRMQYQSGATRSLQEAVEAAAREAARPTRNDRLLQRLYGAQDNADDSDSP